MTYSFDQSLLLISSTSEHRAANGEITLITSLEAMVNAATLGLPHWPMDEGACTHRGLTADGDRPYRRHCRGQTADPTTDAWEAPTETCMGQPGTATGAHMCEDTRGARWSLLGKGWDLRTYLQIIYVIKINSNILPPNNRVTTATVLRQLRELCAPGWMQHLQG